MIKKILIGLGIIVLVLSTVLGVHIYMVTRPKPIDPNIKVLARVDFQEEISSETSKKIMSFLYTQEGVDHVLVNESNKVAIFSFFPTKANANVLVMAMNKTIGTDGKRYLPSEKELMDGCPVNQESFTMKAYKGFARIF